VAKAKRIGVLTSGGDCAGLNAAIRAVTFRAIDGYGWQVFGIRQGTHGLMKRPVDAEELSLQLFTGNILRMGGTILGTVNSGDPFAFPTPDGMLKDRSDEIIEGYHQLGLNALIGIGVRAVDLVAADTFDRLVVWSNRSCTDVPLEDGIETSHGVDPDGSLVHTARGLGIYLGDT